MSGTIVLPWIQSPLTLIGMVPKVKKENFDLFTGEKVKGKVKLDQYEVKVL